jgi:hypothetical protein
MKEKYSYLRRKGAGLYRREVQDALGKTDRYFSARPWGVMDIPLKTALLMGAFKEEDLREEDFYEDQADVLEEIFDFMETDELL